jgi:hypothetical protein
MKAAKNANTTVSIPVTMSKPLAERIEKMAIRNDRTVSQQCARILRLVIAPTLGQESSASR